MPVTTRRSRFKVAAVWKAGAISLRRSRSRSYSDVLLVEPCDLLTDPSILFFAGGIDFIIVCCAARMPLIHCAGVVRCTAACATQFWLPLLSLTQQKMSPPTHAT